MDPAYPLVGDLGVDGVSLYASGPTRILRPLLKMVLTVTPSWPTMRSICVKTGEGASAFSSFAPLLRFPTDTSSAAVSMQTVGRNYILLPQETTYLRDRFISVSVNVPAVGAVMKVSGDNLLGVLSHAFVSRTRAKRAPLGLT